MLKKKCHWYGEDEFGRPYCKALECIVCAHRKCSFFETEKQYQDRQWNFTVKQGEKAYAEAHKNEI